jgi:hypothetical protein
MIIACAANRAVIIGTFNDWLRRLGKTAISVRKSRRQT